MPLFSPRVVGTTADPDDRVPAPPGLLHEQLTTDAHTYRVPKSVTEPSEADVIADEPHTVVPAADKAFFRRGIFARRGIVEEPAPDPKLVEGASAIQAHWRGTCRRRRAIQVADDASVDAAVETRVVRLMQGLKRDDDSDANTNQTTEAYLRTAVSTWVDDTSTEVSTWVEHTSMEVLDDSDAATVEMPPEKLEVVPEAPPNGEYEEILQRALVTGERLTCEGTIHLSLTIASGKRHGLVLDARGGDAVTRECCCFMPWYPWKPTLFCMCSDVIRIGGTRKWCFYPCSCLSYSDVVSMRYFPQERSLKVDGCLSCCIPHPFGQHLHVPKGNFFVDAPVASFGCLCPVFRARERFDLYDDGTIRPAQRPDLVIGRKHVIHDNRLCLVRQSDISRRLVFDDVVRQATAGGGKCVCPRCRRKWCTCCRRRARPVRPAVLKLPALYGVCRCRKSARKRNGTCSICGKKCGATRAPRSVASTAPPSVVAATPKVVRPPPPREMPREEEDRIDAFVKGVLGEKRGASALRRERLKPKNDGFMGKRPDEGCVVM